MIKILFDAGPLVYGNKTGVGRATEGLVLALAKAHPNELELVGHYFDFLHRKKDLVLPSAPNIRYRKTALIPGKVFNMLRRLGVWIPFELLVKERGDFHLFPAFVGWPSVYRTPSAPFVHDVTYIDYPQYVDDVARYDLQKLVPGSVHRSAFVLTNSGSSKRDILRTYPDIRQPIFVEPLPPVAVVRLNVDVAQKQRRSLGIPESYILFFGTLEPRKNLVGLLQAYAMLPPTLRQKYALVLAGGKGWKNDEIYKTISRMKSEGANIIQTGYVTDEQRAALYMNATVYVMPSHYEGFGMQLLEGMSYGVPMLVSDIPVLREVAGTAAAFCGTDPTAISLGLEGLLKNPDQRKDLIAAGAERLLDYSWEDVAEDVYKHIREVVA